MDNPGRRDPKQFEPPPWEKEQFEELSRQRAEGDAEAQRDGAEAATQGEALPQGAVNPPAVDGAVQTQGPAQAGEEVSAATEADVATEADDESTDVDLDSVEVKEMMELLRAEEPPVQNFWRARLAVAAVVGVLGAILMIWGIVALAAAKGNFTGVFGGMVLLGFGVGFIVFAAWTAQRSLQERGVI